MRAIGIAICFVAFWVSGASSQPEGEPTTSVPGSRGQKGCSQTAIKETCLSEWQRLIHGMEFSDVIYKTVKEEKTLQSTCIDRLGVSGWYDGEMKSCRKCSENGCAGEQVCLAECSVRVKLLKTQSDLYELRRNFTSLLQDFASTYSELKELKAKSSEYKNLAILAITIAFLSLIGLVAVFTTGRIFYNRLLVRLEQRGVQQTNDVRYERDRQQREQNNLLSGSA